MIKIQERVENISQLIEGFKSVDSVRLHFIALLANLFSTNFLLQPLSNPLPYMEGRNKH